MSELILELFSEEIPALMQKKAEEAYLAIFTKHLISNEIAFEKIKVFSGPRRIVVLATGLPKFVAGKELEIKGPRACAPQQALEGFCKSNNIDASKLTQKEINGQLFYVYAKSVPQMDLKTLLLDILPAAIKEYVWPKSMYWANYDISWVRPLKNIMCLFDNATLPVKYGHLTANDQTYGHRFMSGDTAIIIKSFDDYCKQLEDNYVILSRLKRQQIIQACLEEIAAGHKIVIKEDLHLLEEVTGLVEWPVVRLGHIDKKFLKVPSEALTASMRTHQKYFSTYDKNGNFAPFFLFVSNIESPEPELVEQGNEKVLSARLSDALYFYTQDLKKGLDAMGEKLGSIVFHETLGSLKDKTKRVASICKYLAPDSESLQLAASLYKNDLTSEMVGEFPELQGIMGHYYALSSGVDKEIAIAIKDHYKPLSPSDNVPNGNAATLALADKIDSITGLMLAGEAPTGSGDPYALRRMALGVIRIILENDIQTPLAKIIEWSYENFENLHYVELEPKDFDATSFDSELHTKEAKEKKNIDFILRFFSERIQYVFKDEYSLNIVRDALNLQNDLDLVTLENRMKSKSEFCKDSEGIRTIDNFSRIYNIIKGDKISGDYDPALFLSDKEKNLEQQLLNISRKLTYGNTYNNFMQDYKNLSLLNPSIEKFFDNVLVNDPDPKIADNRKRLLAKIIRITEKLIKFDQL